MRTAVIYAYVWGRGRTQFCGACWLFYLSSCQIRADDNSSTRAFTAVMSYWWNSRIY